MPNVSEPTTEPVAPPDTKRPARTTSHYWPILVVVGIVAAYPLIIGNSYLRYVGVLTVMYMVLSTSWNLMGGFTGYISLGHVAFFGVGAYATGLLVLRTGMANIPAVLATGLLLGLLGAAIGYVALRVRGSSFVIVTIALVYIGGLLVQGWRSFTGGSMGLTVTSGFTGDRVDLHRFYHWHFTVLLLIVLSLWWFIDRSKFGMGLKAVREDEDKAQSLGVPTTSFKLIAFTMSAGFTGMAGGLYASWFAFLDPIFAFQILISSQIVLMALLGGMRTLWGPVLGAVILIPSTEYFLVRFGETQLHLVFSGLLLGVVVLLMPDGIIPMVKRQLARRHGPAASIREQRPDRADGAPELEVRS